MLIQCFIKSEDLFWNFQQIGNAQRNDGCKRSRWALSRSRLTHPHIKHVFCTVWDLESFINAWIALHIPIDVGKCFPIFFRKVESNTLEGVFHQLTKKYWCSCLLDLISCSLTVSEHPWRRLFCTHVKTFCLHSSTSLNNTMNPFIVITSVKYPKYCYGRFKICEVCRIIGICPFSWPYTHLHQNNECNILFEILLRTTLLCFSLMEMHKQVENANPFLLFLFLLHFFSSFLFLYSFLVKPPLENQHNGNEN